MLIICFSLSSQNNGKTAPVKPSKANTTKGKYNSGATQYVSTLLHDTCLNKQFSIVFYIVLDSTSVGTPSYPGVGAATSATLSQLINDLNSVFRPICVSFVNCTTVYIPNYSYGVHWKPSQTEPIVTATWYTEKTINMYFVDDIDSLLPNNTGIDGYAHMPPISPTNARLDVIVMKKSVSVPLSVTAIHEMGHYFGLYHTFHEISGSSPTAASIELADGSNCSTTGDGICDTEADRNSQLILADQNNNMLNPPLDNYMSYYPTRCRFTQQQYNRMAYIILTKRMYLH